MQNRVALREKLVAAYEKLSPLERTLVQLCAVAYEPTSKTALFNCLRKTGLQFPGEKVSSIPALTAHLDRLQRLQFLHVNLQCSMAFIEVATRRALAAGHYEALVKAVREELPTSLYYYEGPAKNCPRWMREVRIAIYTHDVDLYNKSIQYIHSRCSGFFTKLNPFVQVCNNPFDSQWFATLPAGLQVYALENIFYHALGALEADDEALAYALDAQTMQEFPVDQHMGHYYHLTSRLMMSGRLAEARSFIPQVDDVYTAGLLGSIRFLEGRNAEALGLFDRDLSLMRRRSRKRNIYFSGLPGVFYLLALLKSQDEALLKTLDQLISAVRPKEYGIDFLPAIYAALQAIVYAQRGEPEKARVSLGEAQNSKDALERFFAAMATYWVGGELSPESIDELSSIFIRARELGLSWLTMECAELLCRTEGDTPIRRNTIQQVQQETGMQTFVPFIHIEEPWRKSLRALTHTLAPARGPASKTAAARLVWMIGYHDGMFSLQPREQRSSAKGGWTEGRPVALSRLYTGSKLEYITQQDHAIRGALKRDASYYHYGVSYSFDMDKVLPALAGHPLLFLESKPTVPVEVVKSEPEVIVMRSRGQLKITFSTKIPDGRVALVQETPTRFKLIELSEEHRRIARILGEKGLTVPESARDEVLAAISSISALVTVHSAIGGSAKDVVEVPANPTPCMHLLPSGGGYRLELFVKPFGADGPHLKPGLGAANVIAEVGGKRLQTTRDLKLEEARAAAVEGHCPTLADLAESNHQWFLEEPQDCLQVLFDLRTLQDQQGVVVEWPEGEKLRVTRQTSFDQLRLKIRGRNDWFELSGQLQVDDNLVLDMKQLLELLQKTDQRFLPLGEGQFLALTRELRKRLEELEAYGEKRGAAVRLHPLAALALEDFTDQLKHLDADQLWKIRLKKIRAGVDLVPPVPSTLKAELRDYQVEGYRWLVRLAHLEVGACLADDMGLGKTLQALALMLQRAPQGPALVVAPTSVCSNWQTETKRFAPTLNVIPFGGNNRNDLVKKLRSMDVLVCSYGLLQQEAELLGSVDWHTIVLDEAQAIKNITTKRSQAAMSLKGDFRVVTTGTPIENHLGEFYTLFNFINPGLLGSRDRFNERFAIPIEKYHDRDAKKRLKKLIQPLILRRTKAQVLEELPPRTEVLLEVEMTPEEAAFYEALRQQALSRLEHDDAPGGQKHLKILAEIMKLRRACCHPRLVAPESGLTGSKLELFGEVVAELLENGHKALVFSQFVGHLALLRERLDAKNIAYRYLDGSTPARERKKEVDAFQSGAGDLFLISLKAGGLGLNLTAADYVIHMDPWWNPAVEDQASDRAHRIGQQRPVTVYRLVTQHSIEEKIVRMHQDKRDLATSLLDGSDISGKISAEELLNLIREG